MAAASANHRPHAVCIPFPEQSHIKAMLKLAKLLHHKGFHITFVNTDFNHSRFLKSRAYDSLRSYPNIRFRQIPDGLPPSDFHASQGFISLISSVANFMLTPFCDLLSQLNAEAAASASASRAASSDGIDSVPPVSWIVSDGLMSFAAKAAYDFQLQLLFSLSISAAALMGFFQYRSLLERGLAPLPDENCMTNGYLDKGVDWVPGMKDMFLKDLPTFFRTTDRNDLLFNFFIENTEASLEASALLIQTFGALEADVLHALSHIYPHIYTVDPLQLLLNQISNDEGDLKSIGYSLLEEDVECLRWLDTMEPNSVIYVNFGSVLIMASEQLTEFCWGLADSKCNFLLIIRRDLVGREAILSSEFMVEIKKRGMISDWCPQEQVLKHPSIGCFMTHCGWNSTIESLSVGVPMICCPFLGDQMTNSKFTCNDWEAGIKMNNNAQRETIKGLVIELMKGERGKKLRKKASQWKKSAEDACNPDGSSYMNFDKLVKRMFKSM